MRFRLRARFPRLRVRKPKPSTGIDQRRFNDADRVRVELPHLLR